MQYAVSKSVERIMTAFHFRILHSGVCRHDKQLHKFYIFVAKGSDIPVDRVWLEAISDTTRVRAKTALPEEIEVVFKHYDIYMEVPLAARDIRMRYN